MVGWWKGRQETSTPLFWGSQCSWLRSQAPGHRGRIKRLHCGKVEELVDHLWEVSKLLLGADTLALGWQLGHVLGHCQGFWGLFSVHTVWGCMSGVKLWLTCSGRGATPEQLCSNGGSWTSHTGTEGTSQTPKLSTAVTGLVYTSNVRGSRQ